MIDTTATFGDMRVWAIHNPPAKPWCFPVDSPKDALTVINALGSWQMFFDPNDRYIGASAMGLQVFTGETYDDPSADGWEDWYDEDGDDLDAYDSTRTDEPKEWPVAPAYA